MIDHSDENYYKTSSENEGLDREGVYWLSGKPWSRKSRYGDHPTGIRTLVGGRFQTPPPVLSTEPDDEQRPEEQRFLGWMIAQAREFFRTLLRIIPPALR